MRLTAIDKSSAKNHKDIKSKLATDDDAEHEKEEKKEEEEPVNLKHELKLGRVAAATYHWSHLMCCRV